MIGSAQRLHSIDATLPQGDSKVVGIAIGLGLAGFPFSSAAAYWRWVDLREAGGADSLWQTDRPGQPRADAGMHERDGRASRPHRVRQIRHERAVDGPAPRPC